MDETIEDWKIWFPHEVLYIESLLSIAKRVISDYELLNYVVSSNETFEQDPFILIDLAENIINQSASLSRYLKPSRKDKIHQLRGKCLRESLGILDNNILLSREVRNFIEHFDENLDLFLQTHQAGIIQPKRVVFDSKELDDVTSVFKCYIVKDFKYKTLDREVEITPIVEEVYRIYNLLAAFRYENGGRLTKSDRF